MTRSDAYVTALYNYCLYSMLPHIERVLTRLVCNCYDALYEWRPAYNSRPLLPMADLHDMPSKKLTVDIE